MYASGVIRLAWAPVVLVAAVGAVLAQSDGFVSLSPVADISEHWTVEGSAP